MDFSDQPLVVLRKMPNASEKRVAELTHFFRLSAAASLVSSFIRGAARKPSSPTDRTDRFIRHLSALSAAGECVYLIRELHRSKVIDGASLDNAQAELLEQVLSKSPDRLTRLVSHVRGTYIGHHAYKSFRPYAERIRTQEIEIVETDKDGRMYDTTYVGTINAMYFDAVTRFAVEGEQPDQLLELATTRATQIGLLAAILARTIIEQDAFELESRERHKE